MADNLAISPLIRLTPIDPTHRTTADQALAQIMNVDAYSARSHK